MPTGVIVYGGEGPAQIVRRQREIRAINIPRGDDMSGTT